MDQLDDQDEVGKQAYALYELEQQEDGPIEKVAVRFDAVNCIFMLLFF